eukprot:scaffold83856_cov18-Tisochrysis_lutea.AAC.2
MLLHSAYQGMDVACNAWMIASAALEAVPLAGQDETPKTISTLTYMTIPVLFLARTCFMFCTPRDGWHATLRQRLSTWPGPHQQAASVLIHASVWQAAYIGHQAQAPSLAGQGMMLGCTQALGDGWVWHVLLRLCLSQARITSHGRFSTH